MGHAAGNRLGRNRSHHANPNWQHVGAARALALKELVTMYQLLHSHFVFGKPSTFICARGQGEQWEKGVKYLHQFQEPHRHSRSPPGASHAASLTSTVQPCSSAEESQPEAAARGCEGSAQAAGYVCPSQEAPKLSSVSCS